MQTPIYTVHVQSEYVLIIQEEKEWFHVIISLLLTPLPHQQKKIKVNKGKESKRICLTDFV